MFVTGQQYSIVMNVDLPESDANKHVGKFGVMVICIELSNSSHYHSYHSYLIVF